MDYIVEYSISWRIGGSNLKCLAGFLLEADTGQKSPSILSFSYQTFSFPLFSSGRFDSTSFFQVEVVLVLMWYAWENIILHHCFMGRSDLLYVMIEL